MGNRDQPVEQGNRVTDTWWANLARGFLHPVQVQLVETLAQSDRPRSIRDLEVLLEIERGVIAHHLRRLRAIRAVAFDQVNGKRSAFDIPYRLAQSPVTTAEKLATAATKKDPIAAYFGLVLKACRKSRKLTQEELGFRAALHRTEVSLLERGFREPRLGTLVKLAGALEVPIGTLINGVKWGAVFHQGQQFELNRPSGPEDPNSIRRVPEGERDVWLSRVIQLRLELESAREPGDIAKFLSDHLVFTLADLSAATGADRLTVEGWVGPEAESFRNDEHKQRLHQLKALVELILEDGTIADHALEWFRDPNLEFDSRAPFDLIAEGQWKRVGRGLCEQLGIPGAVWPQPFRPQRT